MSGCRSRRACAAGGGWRKTATSPRYTAQVDARKLGRKMMAFVEIKLAIHSDEAIETFERAISQAPQVQECFLMTGQRDYLLRVLVDDLEGYDDFVKTVLRSVGNISSMETAFALREVEMGKRVLEAHPIPARQSHEKAAPAVPHPRHDRRALSGSGEGRSRRAQAQDAGRDRGGARLHDAGA